MSHLIKNKSGNYSWVKNFHVENIRFIHFFLFSFLIGEDELKESFDINYFDISESTFSDKKA